MFPSNYIIKAGNEGGRVYMGKGDSIYFKYEKNENGNREAKITGTRVAENNFGDSRANSNNMWYLEKQAYQFKPAAYANMVLDEWKAGNKRISEFKTVDNIRPADDYVAMRKKLLSMKMLELLDIHYPKVFSLYYPNDTLKYPEEVGQIRKAAGDIMDPLLLAEQEYLDLLTKFYRSRPGLQTEADYFNYISTKIPAGKVKDALLYSSLGDAINRVTDSSRRQMILAAFAENIGSGKLKATLVSKNETLNKLQRGKIAPPITAEAINGNTFQLANLSNKFIVIDIWATWCGPCKREAPYYKRLAEDYTNQNVVFISLSVDEDKNAWKTQVSGGERVIQLWAKNSQAEVMKGYNVSTIPRFMLIDNKGRIVNAQMPPPSDPEFENILRRETAFLNSYEFD